MIANREIHILWSRVWSRMLFCENIHFFFHTCITTGYTIGVSIVHVDFLCRRGIDVSLPVLCDDVGCLATYIAYALWPFSCVIQYSEEAVACHSLLGVV